jgi:hypothetical protein
MTAATGSALSACASTACHPKLDVKLSSRQSSRCATLASDGPGLGGGAYVVCAGRGWLVDAGWRCLLCVLVCASIIRQAHAEGERPKSQARGAARLAPPAPIATAIVIIATRRKEAQQGTRAPTQASVKAPRLR